MTVTDSSEHDVNEQVEHASSFLEVQIFLKRENHYNFFFSYLPTFHTKC